VLSSPIRNDYLEFCIKEYGHWTKELSQIEIGATLYISNPQGSFVWDKTYTNVVFLLGGIGISPIMSMLRFLKDTKQDQSLTLLYGNRTVETIAYKDELETLKKYFTYYNVVHIFSHLPQDHPWNGYRGFITSDILRTEVNFERKPTFFYN